MSSFGSFGSVSILEAAFNADGSLHVVANLKTNSTGWKVEYETSSNEEGEITAVEIQPVKPTGTVGLGFPSNGQNFELDIPGTFATSVTINGGAKTVTK